MLNWLKRLWRRVAPQQPRSVNGHEFMRQLLSSPPGDCLADCAARQITLHFAGVLEKANAMILDEQKLLYSKDIIRQAFSRRIRILDNADGSPPGNLSLERDVALHQALAPFISRFQDIDHEDEDFVRAANAGALPQRETLLLFMKYHQRAMKEDGFDIDDPLEPAGQRLTFMELRQRMGWEE